MAITGDEQIDQHTDDVHGGVIMHQSQKGRPVSSHWGESDRFARGCLPGHCCSTPEKMIEPADDCTSGIDPSVPVGNAKGIGIELIENIHGGTDLVELTPARLACKEAAGI